LVVEAGGGGTGSTGGGSTGGSTTAGGSIARGGTGGTTSVGGCSGICARPVAHAARRQELPGKTTRVLVGPVTAAPFHCHLTVSRCPLTTVADQSNTGSASNSTLRLLKTRRNRSTAESTQLLDRRRAVE
jgi:hypothetical protein